jgi:hypothetical protein
MQSYGTQFYFQPIYDYPPDGIVKQVASNFCQPSDCQNGSTSLHDEVTFLAITQVMQANITATF